MEGRGLHRPSRREGAAGSPRGAAVESGPGRAASLPAPWSAQRPRGELGGRLSGGLGSPPAVSIISPVSGTKSSCALWLYPYLGEILRAEPSSL